MTAGVRLAVLLVVLGLTAPAAAEAAAFCRWVGLCLYLSPGFALTVVDARTGRPLAGVYGWAEWVQYGAHGTGGPLVVQDAFSDGAGRLAFPRWGPTWGARGGLLLGTDPAVVLFRAGYGTRLIDNGVPPGASPLAPIRGSSHDGQTLGLLPTGGRDDEPVEQLRRLAYPALHAYVTDSHLARFRSLYLRRLDVVEAELARLPVATPALAALRSALARDRAFYTGGR